MEQTEPASARRHSTLVAAGILLSRISGLVREQLLAYFLGAGTAVDAFRVALRIPNLLQNLLGEGVLSASFIPVYSQLIDQGREEEAGRVAGAIAGLLIAVTAVLALVGVVFAEPLTSLIAYGFPNDSAKFELTVILVRILTPGVAFLVLSAWCLGVLNSHRRFFLSYVAPVIWNAGMIAALVAFGLREASDERMAVALAWGALTGGGLQLAVQLPRVFRLDPGATPNLELRLPGVRRTLRALGPVVAGRGVVQLSAYVDVFIASFLATGAIAALGYAQVLYILPISLFGMSVAAAELPELSTMDHGDRRGVVSRIEDGAARIAFFVAPTAVAFVVIGDLIVGMLYERGEFTSAITTQVWIVVGAYAVGLLASTQSRLLQSALYGVGDTRGPALIAAVRVAVTAGLGVLLMLPLDQLRVTEHGVAGFSSWGFRLPAEALRHAESNVLRLGAVGLAAGAAVSAWVEYVLLRRRVGQRLGPARLGGGHLGPTLLAAGAAGTVALLLRPLVGGLPTLLAGPIAIAVAGAVYLAVALRLELPEARAGLETLRRRLGPR